MANVKISALPAVTTVVPGTDVLPLVSNSGVDTTKATPQQIVNAALASPAAIGTGTAAAGTFTELTASSPSVISVNSSSDALRITQTGAGNALIVEDSANPDSTPFVVDASGVVGIGTTTPQSTFSLTAGIGTQSTSAYSPQIVQRNKTNDASAAYVILQKDRAGAIVQSGDAVGNIFFQSYDGASYISAAAITAAVDGTPGTNDMPGRLVFSTTADGASSPTERMRIDNAGRVGIGGTPTAATNLYIASATTGNISKFVVYTDSQIKSDVTSTAAYFTTAANTQASAFTLGSLYHYYATQSTIGAGSAITNQFGFYSASSLTGATNNYGFYSNIASGTGRYNFYAAGSADNFFAGSVGIGGAPYAGVNVYVPKNIAGNTISANFASTSTIQSDVTDRSDTFISYTGTQAAAFTLGNLRHFGAYQATIGAGSTVTSQYGFFADSTLTGATNNYGVYSNIASGTGRYNFYAAGTADNYFAGAVGVGITPTSIFQVSKGGTLPTLNGTETGIFQWNAVTGHTSSVAIVAGTGASSQLFFGDVDDIDVGYISYEHPNNALSIGTNAAARVRIDSSGNLISTAPTTAPTLSTNGTMVFNLTSDTNLRVSVRGSDGVTRTANLTLA